MTLQSAIEATLPLLRAEAEARMTSRCIIRRPGGLLPQDEATGNQPREWTVIYTDLPTRLAGAYRGDTPHRGEQIGTTDIEVAVRTQHFPVTTTDLRNDDLVEITSGENAGLVLRIVEATWQDQATARRVPVVETDRPEEW